MVWNVTKDKITERMAIVDEHTWGAPMASPPVAPDPKDRVGYSPEIEAGYTLYMYEALKAMKQACEQVGIGRDGVEKMFFRNADRLVADVAAHRNASTVI